MAKDRFNLEKLTSTQWFAYEEIKAMVRQGGMLVLPTERSLVRKIGVSKPIIQKVLRVLTAEGEIPPVVGKKRILRNPVGQCKGLLPLIAVVSMTGALNPILRGALWDTIVLMGYNPVFIEITMRDLHRIDCITDPVLKFNGVIAASAWDNKVFKWIESFGCPVVVLDHISDSRRFIDILPNDRNGCKRMATFFHQRGIRSVVYFDYLDETWNPPRWDAFVAATNSCGIEIVERIFMKDALINVDFWASVVKKIPRGSGVFCANGAVCEGFLGGMSKFNLHSPADYAVAYVGENQLLTDGRLVTRYALEWEKSAKMACDTMMELIKKTNVSNKRRYFPVKVFRGKTL